MKIAILDMSPILYGNLFSATNYAKNNKIKKDDDGKYILEEYKDVVIQKIIEELAGYKNKFEVDELILAFDTPTKEGYWRKDIWEGYKSKRKDQRDKSNIQWDEAFELFQELKNKFDNCSNSKVISVPRAEGDDVIFVLSEYLSKNNKVIISSSDHDFLQCVSDNCKFWRTTRTQGMEKSDFCYVTKEEKEDIIQEHIISGDDGDGFGHFKQYSRFSEEFLEKYPQYKNKELELYPKRFKIQEMFKKKYGEDAKAYNHPRFGYKSFKKSKKELKNVLKENKIFEMNYQMNKKLALPEYIPQEIKEQIINNYEREHNNDSNCFDDFLIKNKLFELTSLSALL